MPGAHGKKKSKKPKNTHSQKSGELIFKQDDELYGKVLKPLGCGRFAVACEDGVERVSKIRGNMRKSDWVCVGSLVLLSLRPDTVKADILHKYSDTHAQQLKKYGELVWMDTDRANGDESDDGIEFAEEDVNELINQI